MVVGCFYSHRVNTPLEIASRGLRLNKTKALSLCFFDNGKGRGVRAEEDIERGEYVCEFKYSKCFPTSERRKMEADYEANGKSSYILELVADSKKLCLDATINLDSWGRYINHAHSSQANLKLFQPIMVREKWRVAFLAKRKILAGEELGFDYGVKQGWMKKSKATGCNFAPSKLGQVSDP